MGEVFPARLGRVRNAMESKGVDALLVGCPENRRYISGFTGSDGYLLISSSAAVLATDFRYYEQAEREAALFRLLRLKSYEAKWLAETCSELKLKKVGFESEHLTFAAYRRFVDALKCSPVELAPQSGIVESLRTEKDAGETSSIARAAALAHGAITDFSAWLRAGVTEAEAAWRLEKLLRDAGSQALPFEIIVASGPNGALPHARPSEKVIVEGEPIVIDFGARISGYCCDVTRTLWLGEADEKLLKIRDIVFGAQRTAIELIRPGMTGKQADMLARMVIAEAGYAESFGHGLGHGVGLETHEHPRLGGSSADLLAEGMVFTVEPGIYLSGWGGVRIEDTVALHSKGVKVLC